MNIINKIGIIESIKKVNNYIIFKVKIGYLSNSNKVYKISKKEKNVSILKTKNKIIIFTSIPYFDVGGGQRAAQLAKTFNNMGYPVYYFYAFNSSETKKCFMALPIIQHKNINKIKLTDFEKLINKGDILIIESPVEKFLPFIELSKKMGAKIVYESIDNWETSLGNMFYNEEVLKEILGQADIITATAKLLKKQTENYLDIFKIKNKQVLYLPNAVDSDLFNPNKTYEKPKDLFQGKKTLIYYGTLWGEWINWEMIILIAKSNPNNQINLIGDYSKTESIIKNCPQNIHFLGLKPQKDLPQYLAYSDIAFLPFKPNAIGQYVSPLKIFEYLAMNKPVLSTKLSDISEYKNVYCMNNIEDWIKVINSNINFDLEYNNNFISDNNWYTRCSELLDNLNIYSEKCDEKFYDNISVIILNYNNKNVIEKCINTIQKYNERYMAEIIVVDNQSNDGSYEMLNQKYKDEIKLFKNTKNGCSSGRNIGINNSSKDYIIFLDSDQWIFHKYWLEKYIEIFKNNKNVGAVGWAAGWFNKGGYAHHVVDSFPFQYLPPAILCRKDIGYLGTGGMMVPRELLNKVGNFDENYDPTCYEDTDLSLKIRNNGYEIYYTTCLGVGHLPHQTTKSGSKEHDKLIKSKGDYFISKWKNENPKLLKYIK